MLMILLVMLSGLLPLQTMSQKGMPKLQHASPEMYQNKGKVWGIDTAPNGIVYMASDRGLLEFDGQTWRGFTGSDGFTRSVLVVSDSVIYTGSDLDFGVWNRNAHQGFDYTSLYPFREELAGIAEEFWAVYASGEQILFVSEHNLYVYRPQNLTKIAAPRRFSGSFQVDGTLYFTDEQAGLLRLGEVTLQPVVALPQTPGFEVTGIYQHQGELRLITRESGIYRLSEGTLRGVESPLNRVLESAKVFAFTPVGSDHLAFGTVLSGVYISDRNGNLVHHINRNKGLANNTVLSLHYSRFGHLWMGLDYGVSWLDLHSDVTYVYDLRGDFGTGHAALLDGERFLLGTNKGLFQAAWPALHNRTPVVSFERIPGSEGQVWSMAEVAGEVLIGHDQGLFRLRGNRMEQLGTVRGVWTMLQVDDFLLAGTYNGIGIFNLGSRGMVYQGMMAEILGSASQLLLEDSRTLWVNIPNFGVIRVVLDEGMQPVTRTIFPKDRFLGGGLFLETGQEQGEIQLVTDAFRYSWDPASGDFLQENLTMPVYPVDGRLSGLFTPYRLGETHRFYPVHNGFALHGLQMPAVSDRTIPKLLFREAVLYNNTQRRSWRLGEVIPHALNSLKITVLVPNSPGIWYQHRVAETGVWSAWSTDPTVEQVALTHGIHTISVRALAGGMVTDPLQVSFRIAPPWYGTRMAWALYAVLLAAVFFGVRRRQTYLMEAQREVLLLREEEALQEQAALHRRERMQIEQDRLQAELGQVEQQLRQKTIQLATRAKESEERNRTLLTLREKLEKLHERTDLARSQWTEIYRLMDACTDPADNTFDLQLNELHQEFFRKLREGYPELSGNDLRLCAYVKLGFSSKEIADLMHIQPSSVYISRSRLRKKLNMGNEDDLSTFLNSIS